MRYTIVSDLHAHAAALKRAREMSEARGAQTMVCLGDIVGYGGEPNECCSLLQQYNVPSIIGNHDRAACGAFEPVHFPARARRRLLWTRSVLTAASKRFLASLPETRVTGGFVMAHGSLRHNSEYLRHETAVAQSFEVQQRLHPGVRVCFFGHTHRPAVYEWRDGEVVAHPAGPTRLKPGCLYHINPGSIGLPRYADVPLSFAVYDEEEGTVEFVMLTREEHADLYVAPGAEVRWSAAMLREYVRFAGRAAGNYVRNRLLGSDGAGSGREEAED